MSKREAYPLEVLLKIKQINPDREFEGEDLKVWNDFLESEAENNLIEVLSEIHETPTTRAKQKGKKKKVTQILEPTATESLDYEINEVSS